MKIQMRVKLSDAEAPSMLLKLMLMMRMANDDWTTSLESTADDVTARERPAAPEELSLVVTCWWCMSVC
jgi:hypothetical protein